ncbi:unnamed protein product, partial [Ectocarpus sp. 8 AP-2014]
TLVFTLLWLGKSIPRFKTVVRIGIWLTLFGALTDYIENTGIAYHLLNWPNLNVSAIAVTNIASIVKASSTTVCMLAVILS